MSGHGSCGWSDLLDASDLESGDYLETLLLPRAGAIAAWEKRLVLVWDLPAPGFMVLTRQP